VSAARPALRGGVLVLAALALAAPPRPAAGRSEGPEPGFTGGFGEPTCTACHFDAPEEPAAGGLVVEGVPERYAPGEAYTLLLTLRDPGLERAGFQLAARFAEGEAAGRQAGRLATDGSGAEVVEHGDPPVLFARQTLAGSRPLATHETTWTLRWTAPAEGAGSVVFHAAANAGNDDDSELGDVVHTATARSAGGRASR
jgi:hypothetical protein